MDERTYKRTPLWFLRTVDVVALHDLRVGTFEEPIPAGARGRVWRKRSGRYCITFGSCTPYPNGKMVYDVRFQDVDIADAE